jgi:TonB-dependent receptor
MSCVSHLHSPHVYDFLRVFYAVCLMVVYPVLASAQTSGGLRGSVQDADFLMPVSGATIFLEPAGVSITTDADGQFFLNSVPPGAYRVLAAREGYVRTSLNDIVISAGAVKEVSLEMTAEIVELDEFVVEEEAVQEEAITPLSVGADTQSFAAAIAPELLKASGSGGDIGNATKRLSATAVVDSRYVVIRGLSDRYNVVVLNGARVPSSDPDKRAVNIDIFPSGLVETLISSKTFAPSMPGETSGGYLNIITKRIPKEPFFRWSYSSAYNTRAHGDGNFLTDPSASTGFLGTGRDRALPDQLRNFGGADLPRGSGGPLGNTTDWRNPPVTARDARNLQIHNNRVTAASLLSDRSMGVDTMDAPLNYSLSALAGTRIEDFMGGTLGIVGGFTYSKRYQKDEGVRGAATITSPGQTQQTQFNIYQKGQESLLAGGLLSATLEFSPEDSISMTYFTNIAAEDEAIFAYGENRGLGTAGNGIPLEDETALTFRESLAYTERRLQTLQLSGEHRFPDHGDIKMDWIAAYSMSSQDQPDLRKSFYAYDFNLGAYVSAGDPSPPEFERVWRRLDDTNFNFAMNFDVPLEETYGEEKASSKIEFGASMDYSTRDYVAENFEYEVRSFDAFPDLNNPTSPGNSSGLTLGDALGGVGLIAGPPGATAGSDSVFLARGVTLPVRETYTATQAIPAAYASITFAVKETLEVNVGARLEATDISITTGTDFAALDNSSTAGGLLKFDPLTGDELPADKLNNPGINRLDFLPAISVRWQIAEDMALRSAITHTVARPTFKELAPAISRDPESGDLFVGYVLLEASNVFNWDVRWEWDMGRGDLLALSFFAKYIDKPIEYVYTGQFNTVRNDRSANLYGFEIELNKRLGDVVPFLEGLNFSMNYGYVFSKVTLNDLNLENRQSSGLSLNRPLQGQPEYTFNANLSHDNEDLGLSCGLLLNITGPLLYSVGGRADAANLDAPDVYQRTYTSVDAYLTKRLLPNWELSFRISNLLDEPRQRYFSGGLPFSDIQSGTVYSLGLTAKW